MPGDDPCRWGGKLPREGPSGRMPTSALEAPVSSSPWHRQDYTRWRGDGELPLRFLEAQKETRARKDLVIVAGEPLLFFLRVLPVADQQGEVD